ncbi:MAG: glycosyltransferase [Acidimicrobiales bacterium]
MTQPDRSTGPVRSVVVATPEPLAHRRAGPAVRAIRTAETLAAEGHRVTLASTAAAGPDIEVDGCTVVDRLAVPTDAEVYVVTGRAMLDLAWLDDSTAAVGVDLYDPFQLEALHRGGDDEIRRIDLVEGAHRTLAAQFTRGDRFFCANEPQRSLWLGYLGAFGRLNPATHDADPSAAGLIELAPFGVDGDEPTTGPSPLRAHPGIGPDDPIVVWAGGLHDWLDPETLVRAAEVAARRRSDLRVVFVAGPPPAGDPTGAPERARREADRLGLTDRVVFFHPDWIPHDQRGPMLVDAAIGVCTHRPHLETRFSHRTRFLDHLWAGLPTVSTGGDPLSAQLEAAGAALIVEPGDPDGVADALVDLLDHDDRRTGMGDAARALGTTLHWPDTLAPIVDWVASAATAPDRLDPALAHRLGPQAHTSRSAVSRLRLQWQREGAAGVLDRASRRVRRPSS